MPTGRESGPGEGGHRGRTSTFSKSNQHRQPAVADAQEEGGAGVKINGAETTDPSEPRVRKSPPIGISRPRRPIPLGSYGSHHRSSLTNPTKSESRRKNHGLKTPFPA